MTLKNIVVDILEFDVNYIKEEIRLKYFPEDVFDADELEEWAIENGFVKENKDD